MATPAALLPEEEAALSEYAAVCRSAKAELRDVWLDLELGEEAVRTEMQQIMFRAHMVWNEAVAQAKERQRQLGVQVEEAGREARSIQEELGQAVHQRVYLSVVRVPPLASAS